MLSFGVMIGQFSPVAPIMAYDLNWTEDENRKYITIVNTLANIGAWLGALGSKYFFKYGKRKMIIYLNIALIVAYCLQTFLPLNIWPIIIGKFI
jgi:MFS family permease